MTVMIIMIVRLSILTMTNLNHMQKNCLCVLRSLNCLLQIEQQRSEQDSFVGDALALALCCARFCSASPILFASYSLAPLMRPRHFAWSCAICSHDCWYVEILEGGFEGLCIASSDHHRSVCQ